MWDSRTCALLISRPVLCTDHTLGSKTLPFPNPYSSVQLAMARDGRPGKQVEVNRGERLLWRLA